MLNEMQIKELNRRKADLNEAKLDALGAANPSINPNADRSVWRAEKERINDEYDAAYDALVEEFCPGWIESQK